MRFRRIESITRLLRRKVGFLDLATGLLAAFLPSLAGLARAEDWPQFSFDARHSGTAPQRSVGVDLGLLAAAPLTDAIFTAPVVAGGRVYAVDGAGVAFCLDAATLRVVWKVPTRGGPRNCNNVSSPLLAACCVGKADSSISPQAGFLHFGTMAGSYYVLDAASGRVLPGDPLRRADLQHARRRQRPGLLRHARLGVYALEPSGAVCWTWDYVKERLRFEGDRWSGGCAADQRPRAAQRAIPLLAGYRPGGRHAWLPIGGSVVWLKDCGRAAEVRRIDDPGSATMALCIGEDGTVDRQWHLLDNGGQVDILPPGSARPLDGEEAAAFVPGTRSGTKDGALSFASVSVRGRDVYRCCADIECGFCRHAGEKPKPYRGCYASIAAPVLVGDKAVYGGLDGALYVVPLAGGDAWSFKTPVASESRIPAFATGRWARPSPRGRGRRPHLFRLRRRLSVRLGPRRPCAAATEGLHLVEDPQSAEKPVRRRQVRPFYELRRLGNTNAGQEQPKPPYKLHWIRRYEGTAKHASTFGGGRMYTHTAEGMIFAVEEETGRLLWWRHFPGVQIPIRRRCTITAGCSFRRPDSTPACCAAWMRLTAACWGSPLRRLAELEPADAPRGLQAPGDLYVQHGQVRCGGAARRSNALALRAWAHCRVSAVAQAVVAGL